MFFLRKNNDFQGSAGPFFMFFHILFDAFSNLSRHRILYGFFMILGGFLTPFSTLFRPFRHHFQVLFRHRFFNDFWMPFWSTFGSKSIIPTAIRRVTFSDFCMVFSGPRFGKRFFMKFSGFGWFLDGFCWFLVSFFMDFYEFLTILEGKTNRATI